MLAAKSLRKMLFVLPKSLYGELNPLNIDRMLYTSYSRLLKTIVAWKD